MTLACHPPTRRRLLQATGAVTALAALPGALHAQAAWPNRPLRVVVPFPPGGTTDFVTRLVCTEVATSVQTLSLIHISEPTRPY